MLFFQTSHAVPGQQLYLDEDHRNKLKHPCKYIKTFVTEKEKFLTNNQQTRQIIFFSFNNTLLILNAKQMTLADR